MGEGDTMACMAEFASLRSYLHFEHSVKSRALCVGEGLALFHGEHDEEATQFLRVVLETSASRKTTLRKDTRLFRAQLASDFRPVGIGDDEGEMENYVEIETACSAERMRPDPSKVCDGRANRKGIPYLYLAEEPNTALAEMRPWVGSRITLATFKTTRDCHVIDCSCNTRESIWSEVVDWDRGGVTIEPDARTREEGVWGDIGSAFSKPVASGEIIEYVATQVLAAEFQGRNYDGIVYRSLLEGGGRNVVLFDLAAAKQRSNGCLYKTVAVSYEFDRVDDDLSWPESTESRYCQK